MAKANNLNEDYLVLCPFYKRSGRNVIWCEGYEPGMTFHAAFSSHTKQADWKDRYCRKMCFAQCPIAKSLCEKYDYK